MDALTKAFMKKKRSQEQTIRNDVLTRAFEARKKIQAGNKPTYTYRPQEVNLDGIDELYKKYKSNTYVSDAYNEYNKIADIANEAKRTINTNSVYNGTPTDMYNTLINEQVKQAKDIADYYNSFSNEYTYKKSVNTEKWDRIKEDIKKQSDFNEYSKPVVKQSDGDYRYINNIDNLKTLADVTGSNRYTLLNMISDDEKGVYNYLYAKSGKETAKEYLEGIKPSLAGRFADETKETASNLAKEHPVLSSAMSVPTSLVSGIGYAENLVNKIKGKPLESNSLYQIPAIVTDTIRETVGGELDKTKWGGKEIPLIGAKLGSTLYQTGMSVSDMIASMILGASMTGSIGSGATTLQKAQNTVKTSEKVILGIMSTGAATRSTNNAINRGLSDGQALALGALSGLAEYVSEKIGLDAFLGNPTKAIRYIAKNAVAEGGEEILSDVLNDIADIVVSGNKAEMVQLYKAYVADGMTESEAFSQVIIDNAKNSGASFLGGFLSGLALSGGGASFNAVSNEITANKIGKDVLNKGNSKDIIDVARFADENSLSYKYGQKADMYKSLDDANIDKGLLNRFVKNREQTNLGKAYLYATDETQKIKAATDKTKYFKGVFSKKDFVDRVNAYNSTNQNVDTETFEKERDFVDSVIKGNTSLNDEALNLGISSIAYEGESRSEGRTESAEGVESKQDTRAEEKTQEYIKERIETAAKTYNAETAELLKTSFSKSDADVDEYVLAFDEYYKAALSGAPLSYFEKYDKPAFSEVLNEQDKKNIMLLGYSHKKTLPFAPRGKGSVKVETDSAKLSNKEKNALYAIRMIAKSTGINFVVFADKSRENGSYNNGTVTLNLKGDYNILQTAGHELTHFIKQNSPQSYEELRDYLLKKYEGIEDGEALNILVKRQQELAKESKLYPRELSYDEALEEVIANACQNMLKDSEAITELAKENKSLANKLKEWIDKFVKAINEAFNAVSRVTKEYTWLSSVVEDFSEIQEIWDKALKESVENSDMDTAQKLVDEEAKKAGYTIKSSDPVTYDEDGNVIPLSKRFDENEEDIRFSEFKEMISPRELLTEALDETVQSDEERTLLDEYRKQAKELNNNEAAYNMYGERLKELYFAKGTRNQEEIDSLQNRRKELARKIKRADKKLFELQAMSPLNSLYKRELKRVVKEEYAKGKEQLKEYRVKGAKKAKIDSIKRTSSVLVQWVTHPTEGKSVPFELVKPVLEFLDSLNEGAVNKNTIRWQDRAKSILNQIKDGKYNEEGASDGLLAPEIVEQFTSFFESASINSAKKITELNENELDVVDKLLKVMKGVIYNTNRFYIYNASHTVSEAANEQISELERRKAYLRSGILNFQGVLGEAFFWNMMDSFSYFSLLGSTGDSVIFKNLRKSFDEQIELLKEAQEYFTNATEGTDWQEWTGRKTEVHTFNLSGGVLRLTTGQIMSLYLTHLRETALTEEKLNHILGGGVVPHEGDFKGNNKFTADDVSPVTITEDELNRILGTLTKEQKLLADKLQVYLASDCAKWGNKVTEKMYFFKGYTEEHYYPIMVHSDYIAAQNSDLSSASYWAIKNQSFTKALTKKANAPIVIMDIFTTWANHVGGMAAYSALTLPLADAMRFYNFKETRNGKGVTVKESINRALTSQGKLYYQNFIKSLNGVAIKQSDKFANKLITNAKIASIGANLSVAIQQPAAYARASLVINPKYLIKAFSKKPNIELSKKYSPIAWWKSQGHFTTDLGRSLHTMLLNDASGVQKIKDASLILAQKLDEITWGTLWNAVEFEISETTGIQKGTEEFNISVGERLSEIIDKTQVVDSPFHRNQAMRTGDNLTRGSLMTFFSEQSKNYNVFLRALINPTASKTQKTKDAFKALFVIAVTQFLAAALKAPIVAARDDDEDKAYLEKLVKSLASETAENIHPLMQIPYINTLHSFMQGYDANPLHLASFKSFVTAYNYITRYNNDKESYNNTEKRKVVYDTLYSLSKAISQISGVPASNVVRAFKSIYNAFSEENLSYKYKVSDKYTVMTKALLAGNKDEYNKTKERLLNDGYTEEAITSGVIYALSKTDEIKKIIEVRRSGDYDTFDELRESLVSKGFDKNVVYGASDVAFNKEIPKEKTETPQKDTSKYSNDDLFNSINMGYTNNSIKIINQMKSEGKENSYIRSAITKEYKTKYYELKYKAFVTNNETAKSELNKMKSTLKNLNIGIDFTSWDKGYYEWKKGAKK